VHIVKQGGISSLVRLAGSESAETNRYAGGCSAPLTSGVTVEICYSGIRNLYISPVTQVPK
jgi:hypothetical protein